VDLLTEWATWAPQNAPLVLDADRQILESRESGVVTVADWQTAYASDDFGKPGDRRLHLGLIPQPFIGDLRNASVYILLLNPGLSPTDYYGETVPSFQSALFANLKQEFGPSRYPFIFLDPQFAWHGGFTWWHSKLAAVIASLATAWDVSFAAARRCLGTTLASIELVPYHSASFKDGGGWLRNLQSVALAQSFVKDVVLPRAQRGNAVVIVTRQVQVWGITPQKGVVLYNQGQARAAHLTPNSPGGEAICHFLAKERTKPSSSRS